MASRPQEVVSVGMDDHPALPSHLESELEKQVETEIQALVSAKDWPDYEKRRGSINGLRLAISICKRVQASLGN